MFQINQIIPYSKGISRNKIIFGNDRLEGLTYIDIGKEMSKLIKINLDKVSSFDELCRKIFNQSSFVDSIGRYLAVENIGILFEPELHLNLEALLETFSQGQVLIINAPGEILDDKFYFYTYPSDYTIQLKGLSYKSI